MATAQLCSLRSCLFSAEVLDAIGLVLPWLLRIQPVLTPIAAGGLLIIMTGAVVVSAIGGSVVGAVLTLIVVVALTAVTYGRAHARDLTSFRFSRYQAHC
jgi:hypothetical protein